MVANIMHAFKWGRAQWFFDPAALMQQELLVCSCLLLTVQLCRNSPSLLQLDRKKRPLWWWPFISWVLDVFNLRCSECACKTVKAITAQRLSSAINYIQIFLLGNKSFIKADANIFIFCDPRKIKSGHSRDMLIAIMYTLWSLITACSLFYLH